MATRIVLEEGETSVVLRARTGRRVTCWQLSDPEAGPRAESEAEEHENQGDEQFVVEGGSGSFYERRWGEDSREGSGRETEVGSLQEAGGDQPEAGAGRPVGTHRKGAAVGPVQFSLSVVSDCLRPHGLQHARPPCPSPTPGVYSNSCPLSR